MLGWNPGEGSEQEFFTKEDLTSTFSLEKVNNSPAMFSYEKLDDLNRQHILKMDRKEYKNKVLEFLPDGMKEKMTDKIINLVIRERISKFSEVTKMAEESEFDYYFETPNVDIEKITWKNDNKDISQKHLTKVVEILQNAKDDWVAENIKSSIWDYASEEGRGSVLWPMRYVLSGKDKSPDPFILAEILGKEETIKRLNNIL